MEIKGNTEYLKEKFPNMDIYKFTDEYDGSFDYFSTLHGEAIRFDWDCMTWVKTCLTSYWVQESCILVAS